MDSPSFSLSTSEPELTDHEKAFHLGGAWAQGIYIYIRGIGKLGDSSLGSEVRVEDLECWMLDEAFGHGPFECVVAQIQNIQSREASQVRHFTIEFQVAAHNQFGQQKQVGKAVHRPRDFGVAEGPAASKSCFRLKLMHTFSLVLSLSLSLSLSLCLSLSVICATSYLPTLH